MPNLNLAPGQVWKTKWLEVTIKQIEHGIVYYVEQGHHNGDEHGDVSVQKFQDWIIRRKAERTSN